MYLSTNRYLILVVAAALALVGPAPEGAGASAQSEPPPRRLTCEACLVLDAISGKILFRRAVDRPLPNASTTKMMTALLAAEAAGPRELVRVSPDAAQVGGGGLDLSEGDVYSVRDLLYAVMLDSSNEAAAALAVHVAGDQASFVRMMNRRARRLGATGTSFANPHGLDQHGHASTARDLATIARALLENDRLARIVATPRYSIAAPRGAVVLENRNRLLETYRGAIGVKTGQTLGAGEVLVAAARRGERFLIAVAMRSSDAAADARALLDHGFARLRRGQARARTEAPAAGALVLGSHEQVGALLFDPAGATAVVAGADVAAPAALRDGVEVVFTPSDELFLPLAEGDHIGTVEVVSGGEVIGTVPALADDAVELRRASWATRAMSGLLRSAAFVVEGIAA